MLKMKLVTVQLFLLLGAISVFAQESQKSTATSSIYITSDIIHSSDGKLAVTESTSVVASKRMMERMYEMEKVAAEVQGQDDAALETLGWKLDKTLALLPMSKDQIGRAHV